MESIWVRKKGRIKDTGPEEVICCICWYQVQRKCFYLIGRIQKLKRSSHLKFKEHRRVWLQTILQQHATSQASPKLCLAIMAMPLATVLLSSPTGWSENHSSSIWMQSQTMCFLFPSKPQQETQFKGEEGGGENSPSTAMRQLGGLGFFSGEAPTICWRQPLGTDCLGN